MAVASPARTTALRVLSSQRRRGARARDLMRGAREMDMLGRKARSLATRLILGVNVASGELDRRIDAFVTHASSLQPRVRDALRLAAFEILYLETPRQVAVSQGVELVRGVQPRAARMANAVLRRIAELRDEVNGAREAVAAAFRGEREDVSACELSVASGYPEWLAARFLTELGLRRAAAMCACALDPAPVYVARGRSGVSADRVSSRLGEIGANPEPTGLPDSWRLSSGASLAGSGLVSSCDVAVADLSAQLVCRVAAPCTGRVLEVGQGRGTKSLLLARAMEELGAEPCVCGCELVASKVRQSAARMERAGLSCSVSCVEFDGTRLAEQDELPEALSGSFESALVDAPCSGVGTMRRHPEIAWALDEFALSGGPETLASLQLSLLRAASARVAPGGSLVYATCSVLSCENEDVVDAFLASEEGSGFELAGVLDAPGVASLPDEGRALVSPWVDERGMFQSVPAADGPDGHFCARLVRVS